MQSSLGRWFESGSKDFFVFFRVSFFSFFCVFSFLVGGFFSSVVIFFPFSSSFFELNLFVCVLCEYSFFFFF